VNCELIAMTEIVQHLLFEVEMVHELRAARRAKARRRRGEVELGKRVQIVKSKGLLEKESNEREKWSRKWSRSSAKVLLCCVRVRVESSRVGNSRLKVRTGRSVKTLLQVNVLERAESGVRANREQRRHW
jgi:hypothetical protein